MANQDRDDMRPVESMMNLIRNNVRRWEKAGFIPKFNEHCKNKRRK